MARILRDTHNSRCPEQRGRWNKEYPNREAGQHAKRQYSTRTKKTDIACVLAIPGKLHNCNFNCGQDERDNAYTATTEKYENTNCGNGGIDRGGD